MTWTYPTTQDCTNINKLRKISTCKYHQHPFCNNFHKRLASLLASDSQATLPSEFFTPEVSDNLTARGPFIFRCNRIFCTQEIWHPHTIFPRKIWHSLRKSGTPYRGSILGTPPRMPDIMHPCLLSWDTIHVLHIFLEYHASLPNPIITLNFKLIKFNGSVWFMHKMLRLCTH